MRILNTHPEDFKQTGAIVNGEYVPFYMCKGGGGGGGTQTVQNVVNLPSDVRELTKIGAEETKRLFEQGGQQQFEGERVAQFTPEQQQALQSIIDRGLAPSAIQQGAEAQLLGTLGGEGFGQGFDQAFEAGSRNLTRAFNEATIPQIKSSFVSAGRTGQSGLLQNQQDLAQENLAQSLTDLASGLANQERGRQLQALSLSPTINQLGFSNLSKAFGAGTELQAQEQRNIDAQRQLFEEQQAIEQQNLDSLLNRFNALSAPFAGQTTSLQSGGGARTNRALAGIGGAGAGFQVGSAIGGPVGGAIGAGVGLLGGLFG